MIKITYIDEEAGWQSIAYSVLSDKYEMEIPEDLPQDITMLWEYISESQLAIVDYRLNGNGLVAYTGDDVVRMIHDHNRHFPVIMITSFEDNAIQECTEIQAIRGKEMFNDPHLVQRLCYMIDSAITVYNNNKAECENFIRICQDKIAAGVALTPEEEYERFDAELYLSELDMDSSLRGSLISTSSMNDLGELLSLARTIVERYK